MSLEKLINKKVKFIYLYLIILLFIFILIMFGWSVRHIYEGGQKLKKIESLIINISSIPSNIKKLSQGVDYDLKVTSGKKFKEVGVDYISKDILDGYLLLSKYDGTKKRSIVNLIDLKEGKIIHSYEPDIDKINSQIPENNEKYNLTKDFNRFRYRIIHPLIDDDGGMIFNSIYSPLIKVDVCSELEWFNHEISHHSNEFDVNGDIWTPVTLTNSKHNKIRKNFFDDAINKISKKGETLFSKSVIDILIENNLEFLIGDSSEDPIHLNDIQPVRYDSDFWKKNDLFLSIRELSLILLYRPSTNKIIWYQQYPWVFQHDVDIINDEEIMIFNNNLDWSKKKVKQNNQILIYNFKKNKTSKILEKHLQNLKISTKSEGLVDKVGNSFMIEETNSGRILILNDEEILFRYINNEYENQNSYILNWSRYYSKKFEKTIQEIILRKEKCEIN